MPTATAGLPRTPHDEPPLRILIGATLRARRERQGRTLRDVAQTARVSVPYLSEVERGRKEASSQVLAAVCRALGWRLVDLIADLHAHLAQAEGRVVVDLAVRPGDRRPAHPSAEAGTVVTLSPRHESGTVLLRAA